MNVGKEREETLRGESDQRLERAAAENDRLLAEHTEALKAAKKTMEEAAEARVRGAEEKLQAAREQEQKLRETVQHLEAGVEAASKERERMAEDHKVNSTAAAEFGVDRCVRRKGRCKHMTRKDRRRLSAAVLLRAHVTIT